jgi:hypothetical protein
MPRSRATGFFVRAANALLLVTNWHVVTGLNPANPASAKEPPPNYLKLAVSNKLGGLSEITLPLYSSSMHPLWDEHPDGGIVDIAIYPLPLGLEKHFNFVDIQSAEDDASIREAVAKDVFILGYPFSRDEVTEVFGEDAPYYFPVWKRGSIASEPALRLKRRVLLIDSLSRPGMSGAPVVIAQDAQLLRATTQANSEVFGRVLAGERGAIRDYDPEAVAEEKVKQFRFLGVYSGVIGNTRLAEVALGVCWHVDVLSELFEKHRQGVMPYHAPIPNDHYAAFLRQFPPKDRVTIKDVDGEVIEHAEI